MDDKKKGGNDGNGEKDALEKARELLKDKMPDQAIAYINNNKEKLTGEDIYVGQGIKGMAFMKKACNVKVNGKDDKAGRKRKKSFFNTATKCFGAASRTTDQIERISWLKKQKDALLATGERTKALEVFDKIISFCDNFAKKEKFIKDKKEWNGKVEAFKKEKEDLELKITSAKINAMVAKEKVAQEDKRIATQIKEAEDTGKRVEPSGF